MNKLFDLLDGELTPERAKEVQSHIFSCPDCFTHTDFENRFIAAVKEAKPQICASTALKDKLMSALRSAGLSSR